MLIESIMVKSPQRTVAVNACNRNKREKAGLIFNNFMDANGFLFKGHLQLDDIKSTRDFIPIKVSAIP